YCERGISDYVVRCPYCNSFLGGPRKIPTSAAKSPVSSNGHPKSASSQTKGTIKVPSSGDKGKIRESPAKKAPGDSVLPSSTSSTAKAPRNNRRLIGLIAAICII